jgi:hypothetical protein
MNPRKMENENEKSNLQKYFRKKKVKNSEKKQENKK